MALATWLAVFQPCRSICDCQHWGFWAHRQIHRQAVYLMPLPIADFFRANAQKLIEHAIDADDRRRVDPNEAPQHFIDLDRYGAYPFNALPRKYNQALQKFGYEKLKENGLAPWRIAAFSDSLTHAFEENNPEKIIYYAANLGHYVADVNVPLHATENYDGQLTNQKGIHARWESIYPQKFMLHLEQIYEMEQRIVILTDITEHAFKWSMESYLLSREVLKADSLAKLAINESELTELIVTDDGKKRIEYRQTYYNQLHIFLNQMVEKRFADSVVRVASVWYYSWLKAGKPSLVKFLK